MLNSFSMVVRRANRWLPGLTMVLALGCGETGEKKPVVEAPTPSVAPATKPKSARVDSRPPPMARPVDYWEGGEMKRQVDAATAADEGLILVELGEDWVPYIFTERGSEAEEPVPQTYRDTYLQLARGETPDNYHGDRAREDKYLELYGIMPTLGLLRERFHETKSLKCIDELSYDALNALEEVVAYRDTPRAQRDARWFRVLAQRVQGMVAAQKVPDIDALDESKLKDKDRSALTEYRKKAAAYYAVAEAQARLACEGFLKGKGRYEKGALDWATHEALAELERRHRIYGWGFLGRGTTDLLRTTPSMAQRDDVLRVLTERAMHSAGVLEDGSTSVRHNGKPRTFKGADGKQHPIPNLESEIRERLIAAFGLQTPDSTLAFLDALGELKPGSEKTVAIQGPTLPEYYDGDMELSVVVDRGDVWYEFPFDEKGKERPQPVSRRPQTTIFAEYLGQQIPIARFGTTIGGWRSEYIGETVMWKYKGSPVGRRVWTQIVAAPVWMPPDTTPPKSLLVRNPGGKGAERYRLNYHETGPSYASAYGLVAAYHRKYQIDEAGNLRVGGDEGIRMHGSVDYMSIMRRHSHGCHRLHNHLAVRLMSFVLAHRPHRRMGEHPIGFRRNLEYDGNTYLMELNEGGYVFELERPIFVNVLEGNIRGALKTPVEEALPKYDDEVGAYMMPDGQAVAIDRFGKMTAIELPIQPADGIVLPASTAGTVAGVPVLSPSLTAIGASIPTTSAGTSPRPAPTQGAQDTAQGRIGSSGGTAPRTAPTRAGAGGGAAP